MEAETQPAAAAPGAAAAADGTGAALTTSDALYHCEIEGRDAICQKIKGDLRDGNLDQRHVTKIKAHLAKPSVSEHCCGHRDVGWCTMVERRGAARLERRRRLAHLSPTVRVLRSAARHAKLRLQA